MFVADRTQALQVAFGRHQHAGGTGHRLDDDGGDRRRVMQRDKAFQVVGEFGAMFRYAATERIAAQVVGVAKVIHATEHRPEALAIADHAAHRDAAEVDAVVTPLAADQPGARAFATGAVVGDRHLQRGVGRFRAGIAEEHLVEAGGCQLDELFSQLERFRVRKIEWGREIHLGRLFRDCLDDLRSRMAGVDTPQPGHAIEDLPAFGGPVVHAGRLGQHARRRLELPAGGKRHPERVHGGWRLGGDCRRGRLACLGCGRSGLRVEFLEHALSPVLAAAGFCGQSGWRQV